MTELGVRFTLRAITEVRKTDEKQGNHSPQSEGFFARVKEFFDSTKD